MGREPLSGLFLRNPQGQEARRVRKRQDQYVLQRCGRQTPPSTGTLGTQKLSTKLVSGTKSKIIGKKIHVNLNQVPETFPGRGLCR